MVERLAKGQPLFHFRNGLESAALWFRNSKAVLINNASLGKE